jgi:uncharacterized protein (DUF433 family)
MAIRSRRTEKAAITRTPGVMGGSPCIAGHRIRVADVVRWRSLYGEKDLMAAVERGWPHITREQIEAALAFYAEHKKEIDDYIAEEDAIYEQMQAAQRST